MVEEKGGEGQVKATGGGKMGHLWWVLVLVGSVLGLALILATYWFQEDIMLASYSWVPPCVMGAAFVAALLVSLLGLFLGFSRASSCARAEGVYVGVPPLPRKRARWWLRFLIVAPAVTVLLVAGVYALPHKYRAAAIARRTDNAGMATAMQGLRADSERTSVPVIKEEILTAKQLVNVLKRKEVLAVLSDKPELVAGLSREWDRMGMQTELKALDELEEPLAELKKQISITVVARRTGTEIIEVAVTDEDPERARVLANALCLNYQNYHRQVMEDATTEAIKFPKEQLESVKSELELAENAIEKFRTEQFADLPEVKTEVLRRVWDLENKIPAIERRLARAKEAAKDSPPSAEKTQITKDRKNAKGQEAAKDLPPSAEQMQMAKDRRELQTELDGLKDERNMLAERIKGFKPNAYRYNEMLRNRESLARKYEQYRALVEESQLRAVMEKEKQGTTVEVVQAALRPQRPVWPPTPLIVLLVALAGGISVGGVYIIVGITVASIRARRSAGAAMEQMR